MVKPQDAINVTGGLIAFGLIVILGFLSYALVYVRIPADNNSAFTILLGLLSANVGTIVGWHYGSSSQAKKAADTIDTLAKTAQTAGVALAPPPDATVSLKPGEVATVAAKDDT